MVLTAPSLKPKGLLERPMDPRPLKLIDKADVDDATKRRLHALAQHVGALAEGADRDLQFEFSKTHVAFIVACNQFLRIHRSGDHAGAVEVLLPPEHDVQALAPSISGGVFAMFGWQSLTDLVEAEAAVEAAFGHAAAKAPARGLQ